MSRTYKVHTHKAPRDKRMEADNRGRKSSYRAEVRASLRDIQNLSEADEFYCDPMDFHTICKYSSGYVYCYEPAEKVILKEIMASKKSLLNGNEFKRLYMFSSLDKLIIDSAMQKDSSFSGLEKRIVTAKSGSPESVLQHEYNTQIHEFYWRKGLRELSDEELKALVHKYVASKGGR